jgi:diguanylate cyclase (GGDEF)-like protein
MADNINTEIGPFVKIAAFKANEELGDEVATGGKKILSTDTGKRILNKYEESEIHRDNSFRDPLTGLLNRRGLVEEYRVSMRARERTGSVEDGALVGLDLIGLKKMNIELTPEVADKIIQSSAEYLQSRVRETDLVGRWGGDEILLALFAIKKVSVEKLITEINQNLPQHVHFNIGFALIKAKANVEEEMKMVMNKMEEIKKMGSLDETGRAKGNGVVVDIDSLN